MLELDHDSFVSIKPLTYEPAAARAYANDRFHPCASARRAFPQLISGANGCRVPGDDISPSARTSLILSCPQVSLAHERRCSGYRRQHILLRREGWTVKRKRYKRIYREERLLERKRSGHKRALGVRAPMPVPDRPDVC